MSTIDRAKIAKKLNKTNFKLMTWYFGPQDSAASGLRKCRLASKMSMQSTGKEKFTAYIYFKTNDSDSEDSDEEDLVVTKLESKR